MDKVKIVNLEAKSVDEISDYITKEIENSKLKNEYTDSLEGVFYIGWNPSNLTIPKVILGFVYNHTSYRDSSIELQKRKELESKTGIDLSIENIAYWKYLSEERKRKRYEEPIEFMLRYGTILYDQNGKLKKKQQELEKDDTIASFFDSWKKSACRYEPPIEYKSQQYQKK